MKKGNINFQFQRAGSEINEIGIILWVTLYNLFNFGILNKKEKRNGTYVISTRY